MSIPVHATFFSNNLRVRQTINVYMKKGEEKGYFEFGGSTICLLVKPNIINIDKDILENSKNNIETIVHYREKIATKKEN